MKILAIRVSAGAALVLSAVFWMYGGARAGLYQNMYRIRKFDEILEIEHFEEVPAFVPGIETLFLGFGIFVGLMALSRFLESKQCASD